MAIASLTTLLGFLSKLWGVVKSGLLFFAGVTWWRRRQERIKDQEVKRARELRDEKRDKTRDQLIDDLASDDADSVRDDEE